EGRQVRERHPLGRPARPQDRHALVTDPAVATEPVEILRAAVDALEAPDLALDDAAKIASDAASVAADAAAALEAAARLAARDDIAQTTFL
ncbi:MAG: hypothetical protein Q7T55_07020, partial [Solirubrobacteraceae bacterium]|nr:hypothetical protein [Solirubrobacteraceae bacterium]